MNGTKRTVAVLLLVITASTGVASAQEAGNSTNETVQADNQTVTDTVKTEVKNATQSSSPGKECSDNEIRVQEENTAECIPEYQHQIDNSTAVIGVDWEGDVTTLVIESDRPQRVSIVDIHSIKQKGSGDVTYTEKTLRSGRNVVKIGAESKMGDKTLTIGTSNDLDYISNDKRPFLANGLKTSLLYSSGGGGAAGVILVGLAFWQYKKRKLSKDWTDVVEHYTP